MSGLNRREGTGQGDPDCSGWDELQSRLAAALEKAHESFWVGLASLPASSPLNLQDFAALTEVRPPPHLLP